MKEKPYPPAPVRAAEDYTFKFNKKGGETFVDVHVESCRRSKCNSGWAVVYRRADNNLQGMTIFFDVASQVSVV